MAGKRCNLTLGTGTLASRSRWTRTGCLALDILSTELAELSCPGSSSIQLSVKSYLSRRRSPTCS